MTSKFYHTNNINLHVVEEGDGDTVILLHGFPDYWKGWRYQIKELSKSFKVLAVNMRGYEKSDKPSDVSEYKIEILAADIAGIINQQPKQKVVLIGHDWGAAVAWAVASFYPDLISKLVIINVPHPNEMKKAFLGFNFTQWKKSWYIFFFQLPIIPEWLLSKTFFYKKAYSNLLINKGAITDTEIEELKNSLQPSFGPIAYYRAAFRNINAKTKFNKIECPVMMLWGTQDKALGKELTTDTAHYCSSHFQIHYHEGAGHFVHVDDPDWVNEKLMAFLL